MPYKSLQIASSDDYIKLLAINRNELIEINQDDVYKNNEDYYNSGAESGKKLLYNTILKAENIVDFTYDQETKIVALAIQNSHKPSLMIGRFGGSEELSGMQLYQAHSFGVTCLKSSPDMTHFFSGGSDNCLFIFNCLNSNKTEKKDDNLESDLMLVKKEELDKDAEELKAKLMRIDEEISKAEKNYKKVKEDLEEEKDAIMEQIRKEEELAEFELSELEKKIKKEKETHAQEKAKKIENFEEEMYNLKEEHRRNIDDKNTDYIREQDNYEKEKIKEENYIKKLQKELKKEIEQIKSDYNIEIEKLHQMNTDLEQQKNNLEAEIQALKDREFNQNDRDIEKKREELDDLKREFEVNKKEFTEQNKRLDKELSNKKTTLCEQENEKEKHRAELSKLQATNEKLNKQIAVDC